MGPLARRFAHSLVHPVDGSYALGVPDLMDRERNMGIGTMAARGDVKRDRTRASWRSRAALGLAVLVAGCASTAAPTASIDPALFQTRTVAAAPARAVVSPGPKARPIETYAAGSAKASSPALLVPVASAPRPVSSGPRPYQREGRKFRLTRPIRFETERFGTVVLTAGYLSDGSSSPIADVEGSRIAGFLHDALYAASGHLRFPGGAPVTYTKEDADAAYCAEMVRRGVPGWHARANCTGVRRLPHIRAAWQRLAPKRERRFAQWRARPPLR